MLPLSKQRSTWMMALVLRMLPRNLLPSPSPFEAPLTRPAMSTISIVVGTTRFGRSISASRTSRSSGTVMTPTLGSIVQKGKFAACALAFDRQLNRVDLPTLGRPTIPHCKAIVSRLMLNLPAKIRLSREQCKFICDCRGGVSSVSAKDTNKRVQCRIYLDIAEREYLRRSQRLRISEGSVKFILNIAEREDLDAVEDTRFPR